MKLLLSIFIISVTLETINSQKILSEVPEPTNPETYLPNVLHRSQLVAGYNAYGLEDFGGVDCGSGAIANWWISAENGQTMAKFECKIPSCKDCKSLIDSTDSTVCQYYRSYESTQPNIPKLKYLFGIKVKCPANFSLTKLDLKQSKNDSGNKWYWYYKCCPTINRNCRIAKTSSVAYDTNESVRNLVDLRITVSDGEAINGMQFKRDRSDRSQMYIEYVICKNIDILEYDNAEWRGKTGNGNENTEQEKEQNIWRRENTPVR